MALCKRATAWASMSGSLVEDMSLSGEQIFRYNTADIWRSASCTL